MLKILKNKKAGTDVTLLWTIFIILFSLGAFVPIIEGYFSNTSTEFDTDDIIDEVAVGLPDDEADANSVNALDILSSIVLMFFWDFSVAWWINLILLEPMRIIFYILIYRQIRSGGG